MSLAVTGGEGVCIVAQGWPEVALTDLAVEDIFGLGS